VSRHAPIIDSEYEGYDQSGTSTIVGQAFLKTRGGDVKYGAGNVVNLNPVTTYSQEWFEVNIVQGFPIEPPDQRVAKYHKTVVADGNGRFKFSEIPAGDYYITCTITWEAPSPYGPAQTGGTAYSKVTVKHHETIETVVTR
jgi:hypothetical protein